MTVLPVAGARARVARRRRLPRIDFLPPVSRVQRATEGRVAWAWWLLFFNVLSYDSYSSVLPLPNAVGKLINQAALPVALLVVLSVNRKAAIRSNVYLLLVSLLSLETLVTALGAQYPVGTTVRTLRLAGFVVALWLLSPYWGRDRLILLRAHLKMYFFFVCLSVLGLLISPGMALNSGRFIGIIWPSPATQLAHYAAVAIGVVTLLWLGGMMRGRSAGIIAAVSLVVLLLTHTRTALLAAVVGLVVALIGWLPESQRIRRIFATAAVVVAVVYVVGAGIIMSYLQRGQSSSQLTGLTGRTGFWGPLLAYPRDRFEMVFGFGVGNGTFRGLPIDSNWIDSYQDQGLFGDTVCGLILLFLLIAAFFQARGMYRALALFFVTYAITASFTEDGITNASAYLLDVTVAASLIVPTAMASTRSAVRRRFPRPAAKDPDRSTPAPVPVTAGAPGHPAETG